MIDSDNEIVVLDDNQLTENDIFEYENVESFEINESMENNDSRDSDKCIDGIWEEKSRCFDNHTFTSDFGPNIPDHSTSVLDIFFVSLQNHLLRHLFVKLIYMRLTQKRNVRKLHSMK